MPNMVCLPCELWKTTWGFDMFNKVVRDVVGRNIRASDIDGVYDVGYGHLLYMSCGTLGKPMKPSKGQELLYKALCKPKSVSIVEIRGLPNNTEGEWGTPAIDDWEIAVNGLSVPSHNGFGNWLRDWAREAERRK